MKYLHRPLALFIITLLAACGGNVSVSSPPHNPIVLSGEVQQGDIAGAQVFLDLNNNGVQDSGEPGAANLTGADGKFTLSLSSEQVAALQAAAGIAKFVSVSGTDQTTGIAAGLLVADPPATVGEAATAVLNITPMTTLIAMSPSAQKDQLKSVLNSLGLKDDALIEGSTPAVIAVAKSVETVFITLQKSLSTKTNDNVAKKVVRAAATEMGKSLSSRSKAEIIDTAHLANMLSAAVGIAVMQVPASELTAVHVADLMTWIKDASQEVADAVKSKTGTLATTGSHSEAEIMDDTVKGRVITAVDTCTGKLEAEFEPGTGITPTTKTAVIAFSATSTVPLSAPLQGVTLSEILPPGTTVATLTGSNVISSTALVAASPGMQVTGTFTAETRKVQLSVIISTETFTGGTIASLTVRVPSTTPLAAADFVAPTLIQAAGFDQVLHSTVDLTGDVQTAQEITFN